LPNGNKVKVAHQGKLPISPNLVLDRVLFVPHFKFNLLSVKRLCQQLNCTVQFTECKCTVQRPSLRRPLDLGRNQLGLYVLDKADVQLARISSDKKEMHDVNSVRAVQTIGDINVNNDHEVACAVPFDVWHKRLGHVSDGKLFLVHNLDIAHNKMKHFVCDIYPKAKQHR